MRLDFSGQFKSDNHIVSNGKIDVERNSRETPSLKRFYFLIEYRDAVYSLLSGTGGNKRHHRCRPKEKSRVIWTLAKCIGPAGELAALSEQGTRFY
jgi:hypothetical protein